MSQPDDTLRQSLRQQIEEFLETNEGEDLLCNIVEGRYSRNLLNLNSSNKSVQNVMKGARNNKGTTTVSVKGIFLPE